MTSSNSFDRSNRFNLLNQKSGSTANYRSGYENHARQQSSIAGFTRHNTAPFAAGRCVFRHQCGIFQSLPASSLSLLSQNRQRSVSPLFPLLSAQSADKTVHTAKMETNSDTVPSIVVYGKKLAGSIVKEKLAACVNIVPGIESVYEWEGKINSDPEELLIIKTRQSLLEALTEHIKANHE
ncbi:protein CutA, chloroplastic-like [Hibiscus syriacus]|uniref:protein CutA, chloroplastic-like n=1 Tax=Hibiscus syriacus TaxID=106335 RepID=UPI001921215E|nr:protein CutA, chloroplastic-like [Hibiscus syriacus]